jgi:hypothetical protein
MGSGWPAYGGGGGSLLLPSQFVPDTSILGGGIGGDTGGGLEWAAFAGPLPASSPHPTWPERPRPVRAKKYILLRGFIKVLLI